MAKKLVNAATVAMKAAREEKLNAIAFEIGDCLGTLFAGADKVNAAKDAYTKAGEEHGVNGGATRIDLFRRLAGTAHRNQWEASQIDAAIDVVKTRYGNRPKITVASFVNDVRRICDPDWREHVGTMFDRAKEAFKANSEQMKEAYKKEYHYVMNTLLPVRDNKGNVKRALDIPPTAMEAVARASQVTPKPAKSVDPLAVIAATIATLKGLPDCAALKSAIASLENVSAASFGKDSSAAMTQQAAQQAAESKKSVTPTPAPSQVLVPAEGVTGDILDELAGDVAKITLRIAALRTK